MDVCSQCTDRDGPWTLNILQFLIIGNYKLCLSVLSCRLSRFGRDSLVCMPLSRFLNRNSICSDFCPDFNFDQRNFGKSNVGCPDLGLIYRSTLSLKSVEYSNGKPVHVLHE